MKSIVFKIVGSFIFILSSQKLKAQKIDSDSLLSVIIKDMKNGKTTSKRGLIAKKIQITLTTICC
jgi:hypothetical protein